MRSAYSDIGIVIRVVDFLEADKLVSLITRDHGFVDLIAKGARRQNSKKSAHIDLGNLVKIQTGRGNEPQLLLQAESENYFPQIKTSYPKTQTLFIFFEILNQVLPKEVEDPKIFLSLLNFLLALENCPSQEIESLSRNFGLFLLKHIGYPLPPANTSITSYLETIINRKLISKNLK